ncbi:MAG TPA: S8 family serine peptidase, partial [Polyangiaceae bacterium]|nr:S8 family serine peptidase [Polyangiaceae bacterium]
MLRSLRLAGCALLCSLAPHASAQLELGSALRSLRHSGTREVPSALLGPGNRVALLAEYPADSALSELLVGGRYRPIWLTPGELTSFVDDHPELKLHWAPRRRTLLDDAQRWVGAATFRNTTGLSGKGVVVGIIDTGLDVRHGDLRAPDGASRVRFYMDFSRPPSDRQPALEEEYGCGSDSQCAIYDNTDLDALIANGVTGDEPNDVFGHGTHVASLATGNGLASKTPKYIGIAPEATIFGARVSRTADGSIQDPDIILATRFVFEQAERLGMPAVVNLSLGSDFGAHDGSSALEQALASFVGPKYPGRAIVVAAGNSGGLYGGIGSSEPEPYGIHTEVHVPRESPVEIPILTPTPKLGGVRGASVFVWLGFRPGDDISIGVDASGKELVPEVPPGKSTTYARDGYSGTVFNGLTDDAASIQVGPHDAVVVIDGDFAPGTVFTLRLSGHGTANLWLEATGGAS